MDSGRAQAFAQAWIAAWNAQDLDAILSHYGEDIVLHSPMIARVTGEDTDSLAGKAALRSYWRQALEAAPDLRFACEAVLVGSDVLTVLYRNQRGRQAAETFVFNSSGQVTRSMATYG